MKYTLKKILCVLFISTPLVGSDSLALIIDRGCTTTNFLWYRHSGVRPIACRSRELQAVNCCGLVSECNTQRDNISLEISAWGRWDFLSLLTSRVRHMWHQTDRIAQLKHTNWLRNYGRFRVNREDIVSLPHFSCLIGLGSSILFVIYLVDLFRMQKQRKADYNLQILTGRRKNFC